MTDQPRLLGGRYELGALLGRGGMAEVRRARDTRLSRDVAVKQLRVDLAGDSTFQARFRREAQASAGLNHPNIVAVYDTGEEPDPASGVGVPYIVMEVVEGHTLRDILRDGRKILPRRALEFTQGVLDALSYSHKAGIVHRDIKPANVMLTSTGTVKVMDFGIARAVADTSATMTQTAAVIGTAQYLSPEQARGETVDARSDIYSAGCLLYELLVGRPPFQGDSPVSVAYQHVRENPVPPSQLDPLITPAMDAIALKALAKDPAHRYQTAAAMRADIARLLAGQEVSATIPKAGAAGVSANAATAVIASSATPTSIQSAATGELPSDTVVATGTPSRAVEPDPKDKRRGVLMPILAAFLVIAVGIGAYLLFNPAARTEMVAVPSVYNYSRTIAEQALRDARLTPKVEEVTGPDDGTVDHVTAQKPLPNVKVPVNSEVIITVNVGPKKATIPTDLVGEDVDSVVKTLKGLGFTNVTKEKDSSEPLSAKADEVTRINPAEGATVALDSAIVVSYAVGEGRVPNLYGLTRSEAKAEAKRQGFDKLSFTSKESTQPRGTVIDQSPEAGSTAKRTTTLKVVLASPVSVPTEQPTQVEPTTTPPTEEPTNETTTSKPSSSKKP